MSVASRHTRVKVEQEHFIPVSKCRLVETLLQEIDDVEQKGRFEAFCRLIEAIYHFDYHQMSQQLKQDFKFFDSVNGDGEIRRLTATEIEQVEDRFLTNFTKLMEKANFRLLSQADIDVANVEEYLFSLPVRVDWEKLDREMLGRFLQKRANLIDGTSAPRFADRILIFHRGVGVDTTSGLLILPKVDLLLTKLLEAMVKLFTRPAGGERAADLEPAAQADNLWDSDAGRAPGVSEERDTSVFDDRYIERINLRNSGIGFRSLFQRTMLQEPTFKELVILFRFAPSTAVTATEDNRKVFVKAFRDIPMADLEVVYPAKRISMDLIDRIKLVIIGAAGVVIVLFKLVFAAALNPFLLFAALLSVGGYGGKIFAGFKAAKDRYHHLVTQSLYHKNLDNDLGVIFYVVDALEEQEFNEAVLAYFILSHEGEMTEKRLDACCERYLKRHFDVEVNFEVNDALGKLVREKIVFQTGDQYRAASLEEATRQLDCNWDSFFSYSGIGSAESTSTDED